MTAESGDRRQTRLAAALKENLKRRKAQARARAASDEGAAPGRPELPEPGGIGRPKPAPKRM